MIMMMMAFTAIGCTATPTTPDTTFPAVTRAITKDLGPTKTINGSNAISPSESNAIAQIFDWHERWRLVSDKPSGRDYLIREFDEQLSPVVETLNDPLQSMATTYFAFHSVVTELWKDQAMRSASFAAKLGPRADAMSHQCDLPDLTQLQDSMKSEVALLELECTTLQLSNEYLGGARDLAEMTWLNPQAPTTLVEPLLSEIPYLALVSDWHRGWDMALSPGERAEMAKELDNLDSSISSSLSEPLASTVRVYLDSHMMVFMLENNLAHRTIEFVIAGDLSLSDVTPILTLDLPCKLPEEVPVPEGLRTELGLLEMECFSRLIANIFLHSSRELAEETWLIP